MQNTESMRLKFRWLWVVPILLLSFSLAIPHYSQDAVWFDEAYTHLYSGTGLVPASSITDSLFLIAKTDPWPPGYYLLTMAWGKLSGRVAFADYVLPSLLGLVAISVIFQLGKTLLGTKQGIIASLMIATSAIFIHYTHENRAYTLYILVIASVALYYWLLVKRLDYERRWLRWGFPLAIAAALYTHFVASAFLLGIIMYHLLCEHPSRSLNPHMMLKRWQDIIRLWINGCLLFTPWFAMLLGTLATESSDNRGLPIPTAFQYIGYSFTNNLWVIFLVIFFVGILFWKTKEVRFLGVWLLSSATVVLFINSFVGFLFHPRHVLPFLLIMLLIIVFVLDKLGEKSKSLPMILVGLYAGAGIAFSITPDFMYEIPTHTEPMPLNALSNMQAITEQCVQENDAVIFSVDDAENDKIQNVALEYYFLGELAHFRQFGGLTSIVDADGDYRLLGDSEMRAEVGGFIADRDTVWFMHLPRVDNLTAILRFDTLMAQEGYQHCEITNDINANIWFYTSEETCETVTNLCQ